jgi:hypothetical protein
MTYDEVMDAVDKNAVGEEFGGKFPFSERYQAIADKYSTVGEMRAKFYKDASAMADPLLNYKRDQFYFQNLQVMMEASPVSVKALFAPKPHAFDILKMNIQDMLDEEEGKQ